MPVALYVLTLAAFAIGTTEFAIMGLLPDVATDLHVDLPQAGLLVSAYAMGVVIGGPVLALLTAKLPKRTTLLGVFAFFMAGNIACAMAPSYFWLMLARMATAWTHGTFLGVAGVVATALVPAAKQARANSMIFSGITLANVLGVPAGIAIGHAYGWRATFWAVTAVAAIAVIALMKLLPPTPRQAQVRMLDEFVVFKDARVIASLALSVSSSASLLCLLTFLTPFLTEYTGVTTDAVTWILLIFGLGLTLGGVLAGYFGDRNLLQAIGGGIVGTVAMLLVLPFTGQHAYLAVLVLFLWGMFAFGLCPLMHTLVMRKAAIAPTLASTLNHSAFNLGNATGAWCGSMALSHGQPIGQLPYTCVALAAVAMALLLWCMRLERLRSSPRLQPIMALLPDPALQGPLTREGQFDEVAPTPAAEQAVPSEADAQLGKVIYSGTLH